MMEKIKDFLSALDAWAVSSRRNFILAVFGVVFGAVIAAVLGIAAVVMLGKLAGVNGVAVLLVFLVASYLALMAAFDKDLAEKYDWDKDDA